MPRSGGERGGGGGGSAFLIFEAAGHIVTRILVIKCAFRVEKTVEKAARLSAWARNFRVRPPSASSSDGHLDVEESLPHYIVHKTETRATCATARPLITARSWR